MKLARMVVLMPLLVAAWVAGCRGGRSEGDTSVVAGDAGGIEVEALNYEVTAERYRRWVAAQRALDALPGIQAPPPLDPFRVTDAEIDRAVRYLESDARARAALARAGVSARDYVLTSIALDQALVVSTPQGTPAVASSSARPSGAAPGGSAPRTADRSPTSATPSTAAPATPAAPRRTRTRYRNVPPQNQAIVESNREEIAKVRSGMRFHIVKERPDTAVAEAVEPTPTSRMVAAGTTITLRSDARVCASSHKAGDQVTGTVTTAAGSGDAIIPVGAQASLRVVAPPRAGTPMELSLSSISIDGQSYPVAGSAVASRVDRVRLAGSRSRDAQKVVGGAAIGAVAGRVLGKDTKSTVIGAAVGAAAGAAAADAGARYDSCVEAGAPIQVTLRDQLALRM